jgi:hypothetical protein
MYRERESYDMGQFKQLHEFTLYTTLCSNNLARTTR